MDRARRTRTAAVVATLLMLAAASPASAKRIKPKPGPWVGKTIQRWTPPGSDQSLDYGGRKLTFTLVRVRGGPNPRYRVKNFKTVLEDNPFVLGDCDNTWFRFRFSSAPVYPLSYYRFVRDKYEHHLFDTNNGKGYYKDTEYLDGRFKGRLRARGTAIIYWDTKGYPAGPQDCTLRARGLLTGNRNGPDL